MQHTSLIKGLGRAIGGLLSAALLLGMAQPALAQLNTDLQVTEVMYTPLNEQEWEWIEVRNTGLTDIDLDGWLGFNLNDAEVASPNPTILSNPNSSNTVIPAGKTAIIYDGFHGSSSPGTFDDSFFRDAWGLEAGDPPPVPLLAASFWPGLSNTEGSDAQSIAFWANATDYQADLAPVEDPDEPGTFVNRVVKFDNAQFSLNFSDAAFPGPVDGSSMTWTGQGDHTNGVNWVVSENDVAGAVTSTEVSIGTPRNNINDIANPGKVTTTGTAPNGNLMITEIMYDPASSEPDWEWVELHNPGTTTVDLAGYVMDDSNSTGHDAANIAAGTIGPGETAILYNDTTPVEDFQLAWGATLNLIPVSNWTSSTMALNQGGDTIGLWDSFENYTGDNVDHANAIVNLTYTDDPDFPDSNNSASITLNDLGADPTDGLSWDISFVGDAVGSNNAAAAGDVSIFHAGGDIGSPGSFTTQTGGTVPGDYDNDGLVGQGDLDLVLLNWGSTAPPVPGGWINEQPDGLIGQTELDGVLLNWGNMAPALAAASVPEPTTVVLLGLATLLLPATRRQRS